MAMNWRMIFGVAFLLLGFCVESSLSQGSPCDVVRCASGTTCKVNSQGQAECVETCPTMCPMIYEPVCGSDGKTYSNGCMREAEECRTGTTITEAHAGECETTSPCAAVTCPAGQTCESNSEGQAKCVSGCPTSCTKEYAPVCGSNGKTYGNKCMLEKEACDTGTSITLTHTGACETGTTSSSNRPIPPKRKPKRRRFQN